MPGEAARKVSRRTPVVLLARPTVLGCDSVSAENAQSARALTQHLIDHGRRRLFFVGDPDASPDTQERYLGFTEPLSASDASAVGPPIRVAFTEAIGDDYNTPRGLAQAETAMKLVNSTDDASRLRGIGLLFDMDRVLGLGLEASATASDALSGEDKRRFDERAEARVAGGFNR